MHVVSRARQSCNAEHITSIKTVCQGVDAMQCTQARDSPLGSKLRDANARFHAMYALARKACEYLCMLKGHLQGILATQGGSKPTGCN